MTRYSMLFLLTLSACASETEPVAAVVSNYTVDSTDPALAADNLIVNPFFHGAPPFTGSTSINTLSPWVDERYASGEVTEPQFGCSHKKQNPTDIVASFFPNGGWDLDEATAARFAFDPADINAGTCTGWTQSPNPDLNENRLSQIVGPVSTSNTVLKFDMRWVSHVIKGAQVRVYGCTTSSASSCTANPVWKPWAETSDVYGGNAQYLWGDADGYNETKAQHATNGGGIMNAGILTSVTTPEPETYDCYGADNSPSWSFPTGGGANNYYNCIWPTKSALTNLDTVTLSTGYAYYKVVVAVTVPPMDGGGGTYYTMEPGFKFTGVYFSATAPAPYCGDASCNGTETCGTCATDCGSCSCTPAGQACPGGGEGMEGPNSGCCSGVCKANNTCR